MSITTIAGHLVHYEVFGRGTPLVFIHGWLGSWRYWWSAMQALSNHHRNFAIDLWGFGDSGKDRSNYSLEANIELLDIFVNHLGVAKPFNLAGHALGAAVALRFANKRPESINKLILISLPLKGQQINNQLLRIKLDSFTRRQFSRAKQFPEIEMGIEKADSDAVRTLAQELSQDDFSKDLDGISIPTLMIHGDCDSVVEPPHPPNNPVDTTDTAVQEVILSGCDHFPMLEKPAVFNRLVQDFIIGNSETGISPKQYWQRRTR
jgi:pimeloyl-ACP methyl ester carboxylesterase